MPNADQLKFDAGLSSRLACPACQGKLQFGEEKLSCASCGRVYPIIDGIPVLIADRAIIVIL
jgi:uncharacterized protein YbaR (Trm112 family)